jgi:hypothetical protein
MWRWAHAHGSDELVAVVNADVAEDVLLAHLDAGTAPDWQALRILADLATDAMPADPSLDGLVHLDAVPDLDNLTLPTDLYDWTTPPGAGGASHFESHPSVTERWPEEVLPVAVWDSEDGDDSSPVT